MHFFLTLRITLHVSKTDQSTFLASGGGTRIQNLIRVLIKALEFSMGILIRYPAGVAQCPEPLQSFLPFTDGGGREFVMYCLFVEVTQGVLQLVRLAFMPVM